MTEHRDGEGSDAGMEKGAMQGCRILNEGETVINLLMTVATYVY